MSTQNIDIKAGKLFCLSRGEYSYYGYVGHFLALHDISRETMQEIVDECRAEEVAKDEYGLAADIFIPALIRKGIVVSIDVHEIHTGSYGELSLS